MDWLEKFERTFRPTYTSHYKTPGCIRIHHAAIYTNKVARKSQDTTVFYISDLPVFFYASMNRKGPFYFFC